MAEEILYSTGKRKTAIARVWLKPGNGQITINGKSFEQYLPLETVRVLITEPLKAVDKLETYNILVTVKGGGLTGQAGAIRHGISRALVAGDIELRAVLKKEGFLTRDSRMKERKKYGQPGARAKFQYSKR